MPFSPFFVIFGHILSDPMASTVKQDLQLLDTTVFYFESMRMQLSLLSMLASRLARTARIFHQLAQRHVATTERKSASLGQDGASAAEVDFETIEDYLKWLSLEVADGMPLPINVENAASNSEALKFPGERTQSLGDVFDWFSWETYYENGQD